MTITDNKPQKLRRLTLFLYGFGFTNIATAFTVPLFFAESLLWQPRSLATDLMVGSLYLALGIVMVSAAKRPEQHKALIDFIILSSLLHGAVMVVFAQQPLHIAIDALFLGLMGLIPLWAYPWPRHQLLRF